MNRRCEVDHEERRQMGLLACYGCKESIQSIDEANAIRLRNGMSHYYGADMILRPAPKPDFPGYEGLRAAR